MNDKLTKEIHRREVCNLVGPFPIYDTEVLRDLKILNKMITKQDDYNNVPVTYCKTCLSLHLKDIKFDKKLSNGNKRTEDQSKVTYCIPCGNTDVETSHISVWEDLYEEKYNERFLTSKKEE